MNNNNNWNGKKIKINERNYDNNNDIHYVLPVEKSRQELIKQLYICLFPSFQKNKKEYEGDDDAMKMDNDNNSNKNQYNNDILLDIIIRMEGRTYKRFLGNLPKYGEHMKMVLESLKDDTNEVFRESIVNGTISPEKICKLKYKHMANPKEKKRLQKEKEEYVKERNEFIRLFEKYGYWEKDMEEKMEELEKNNQEEDVINDDLTKDYICKKCGHKEISYQQKQTRSMDEPMTVFFTCKKCHHMWKE